MSVRLSRLYMSLYLAETEVGVALQDRSLNPWCLSELWELTPELNRHPTVFGCQFVCLTPHKLLEACGLEREKKWKGSSEYGNFGS